jgi:hypothetical protein
MQEEPITLVWNVESNGAVEHVITDLDNYGDTLSGNSKDKFLVAKPHLQALISMGADVYIKFDARQQYGDFTVGLTTFYLDVKQNPQ